ncbi:glycosyltransferase family 25 protein [Amaricoccus sp.]|uniref:glycosyltransferase family 25 protein n=1 Tax=Amaricoccus sp. TaxID=1872485 RepID=UPI001B6C82BC|nr:glycosyltransferase family 25 protein [Amaricoccus sp.]MBP7000942.1 glycosyltransferase family 25 protein [Amaricoccus sp.]
MSGLPVFLINLDRRPDRRAYMEGQLAAMGLSPTRIPAKDAETVSDAEIAAEVALSDHLIRMGRGSQCNALNHFEIMRRLVASDAPAAITLEDDIELSPDLAGFAASGDWLPEGIGIVRLEKWSRRATKKLLGPEIGRSPAPGRTLRRLYSRIGGSGAYVITRAAAARILEAKGILRHPIDHLLFNLNISPLAREVGVAMVVPALARQAWGQFSSDIAATRKAEPRPLAAQLRRGWYEVNLAPSQLGAMLFRGARPVRIDYAERTA